MILAAALLIFVCLEMRIFMLTIKSLADLVVLAVAHHLSAWVKQTGMPAGNAWGMSGGPCTHQGAEKTGSNFNKQKVEKNQNGYQGGHQ